MVPGSIPSNLVSSLQALHAHHGLNPAYTKHHFGSLTHLWVLTCAIPSAPNMLFFPTLPLSDSTCSRKSILGSRPPLFISLSVFPHRAVYSAGLSSSAYLSLSATVLFLLLEFPLPSILRAAPLTSCRPLLECHLASAYQSHFPPTHHFLSP